MGSNDENGDAIICMDQFAVQFGFASYVYDVIERYRVRTQRGPASDNDVGQQRRVYDDDNEDDRK